MNIAGIERIPEVLLSKKEKVLRELTGSIERERDRE
jgi:hypothetical protein